ncbi:MAG: metallophosphoesterase family protein [Anaerolineae bacterium]
MRIGVISDTHDDLRALEQALSTLQAEEITMVLHCGDLCAPSVVEALSEFDTWIARGNMDRHAELEPTARELLGAGRLADRHNLTLAGRSAVLVHGHREDDLRRLISTRQHAYVLHGHTHRRRDQRFGPTRVINPGGLGGMRWQRRSFCILDPERDQVDFHNI